MKSNENGNYTVTILDAHYANMDSDREDALIATTFHNKVVVLSIKQSGIVDYAVCVVVNFLPGSTIVAAAAVGCVL